MAFLVFQQTSSSANIVLRPTGESFSLAGYNLLYSAWGKRGRPTNQGWYISIGELLALQGREYPAYRLLIDFDPNSKSRIGLIEIQNIYAYTFANDDGSVSWTPLMLQMRDVFYEEYDTEVTPERKQQILSSLPIPDETEDFVEFLYLKGPQWNWGKNGMTNAAFIQGPARKYFRQFM